MNSNSLSELTTFVVQKFLIYTEYIDVSNPTKLGVMTALLLSLFWFFAMTARGTKHIWVRFVWAFLAVVFLVNGGTFLIAALQYWT